MTLSVNYQVLRFQVSVNNVERMQVLDRQNNLSDV